MSEGHASVWPNLLPFHQQLPLRVSVSCRSCNLARLPPLSPLPLLGWVPRQPRPARVEAELWETLPFGRFGVVCPELKEQETHFQRNLLAAGPTAP